jgi:hypothetical protein
VHSLCGCACECDHAAAANPHNMRLIGGEGGGGRTQPKLKYYLEVEAAGWDEAWELASRVEAAVVEHLIKAEQNGLTRGPLP